MKKLMLCVMLVACSQAWAEEKHLLCTGELEQADQNGTVRVKNLAREFKFDEEDGYININLDNEWEKCRDPEFTPEKIKCNLKGDLGTSFMKKQFEIDRYTGILYRVANLMGVKQEYRLQCKAVVKEEQLF